MNYTLIKTQVKNGFKEYRVVDETGKVISNRKSKRDYVACTIGGRFYFGRIDLIGKGDHGKYGTSGLIAYLEEKNEIK